MTYVPPTREQLFVLEHISAIDKLAEHKRFADASGYMVGAILEGAGQLAAEEWAPLNRLGDTTGAKLTKDGVVMPAGYAEAYRAYVEGGWGTIAAPAEFGGQGMPFCVAISTLEALGSANMAFSLCPMLSVDPSW